MSYPKRMYHPDLGREIDAADEAVAAIHAESGWLPAPGPVERPGYAPEPVRYVQGDDGKYHPDLPDPEPVKAKRAARSTEDS